ncbi:MAG: hypothetical protein HC870_01155, partial [Rhizobiales bacterium]|nr:hypothetical protein [Hyphomicrobiales bacterium]
VSFCGSEGDAGGTGAISDPAAAVMGDCMLMVALLVSELPGYLGAQWLRICQCMVKAGFGLAQISYDFRSTSLTPILPVGV